jgi:hypothetical protein
MLPAQRRYATLVALAIEGMATVTDEIIDLHDRILGTMAGGIRFSSCLTWAHARYELLCGRLRVLEIKKVMVIVSSVWSLHAPRILLDHQAGITL